MIKNALRAVAAMLVFIVVLGLGYPLAMTGIAQLGLKGTADGSLVEVGGHVVGSSSIGQAWDGDGWFHGRPSAVDYDASTSSGSNLGPTSQELADQITERVRAILALEGPFHPDMTAADIPADLVTASGSGLDPDISVASADLQAARIAAVRGLTLDQVMALIDDHTQGRVLGFLGEPRVNVLELNVALDVLASG